MAKKEDITLSHEVAEEFGPAHRIFLGFPFSMDGALDDAPVQERQVPPKAKIPDLSPR